MIERKNCPDCGSSIGAGAYKCRCGWKASASESSQPMMRIECAYSSCLQGAIAKVKTNTGWANLCIGHYETQHQGVAIDYADEHGIKTPSDHILHMRKLVNLPREHRAWMLKPKSRIAADWAEKIMNKRVDHVEQEHPELETAVNF